MRDDEARTCGPRIHTEAALASQGRYLVTVDSCEGEAELTLQLVLPLPDHTGGRGDDHEIYAAPKQQLSENQSGLDRLPRPDVIRNQQVHARKAKRLPERQELIGIKAN